MDIDSFVAAQNTPDRKRVARELGKSLGTARGAEYLWPDLSDMGPAAAAESFTRRIAGIQRRLPPESGFKIQIEGREDYPLTATLVRA